MTRSQNVTSAIDTSTEKGPQQQPITARANAITPWNFAVYLPLLIPIALFFVSLSNPPTIDWDSGMGFVVLRGMLERGSFNIFMGLDHADFSRDFLYLWTHPADFPRHFLYLWTPGQYMVPGALIWLGSNYGLALSLTTLIATLTGVIGWAQVARGFAVTPFVLIAFVSGLVSFRYATFAFRNYHGGEILLFAVAPWALYVLQRAVEKPPLICFAISLLSAALLFFAKETGLLCFGANVLAISLLYVAREARLSSSIIAMWAASLTGALLYLLFWPARDLGVGSARWLDIWFPVAGTAFAGFSGLDLLKSLLMHSSEMIAFDPYVAADKSNYVLGPVGLLFIILIWFRIRGTRYRAMAILLLSIAAIYTAALIVIYYFTHTLFDRAAPFFEERHLRYSGIIVFLLFLVAIDQSGRSLAKSCALLVVGAFAAYGLMSFTSNTLEPGEGRDYDRFITSVMTSLVTMAGGSSGSKPGVTTLDQEQSQSP